MSHDSLLCAWCLWLTRYEKLATRPFALLVCPDVNAMRALMRRADREMTGGVGIKAPPIRAAGTTPGATKELTIGCDDRGVALAALNGYVPRAWRSDGLLRVVVEGEARAIAAAVNSRLVEPG